MWICSVRVCKQVSFFLSKILVPLVNVIIGLKHSLTDYVNSWMSVYQDAYYKMVGVQVHELG